MKHFDYVLDDFIGCEVCGNRAVDIHHIVPRGGGFKEILGVNDFVNNIQNLVALCRGCHIKAEQSREFNKEVKKIHLKNLEDFKNRK